MGNSYSLDYCLNEHDRFDIVGFPELGRNIVFFDKYNQCYIKFYGNSSHFTNEREALRFYDNFTLVPHLEFESYMCIGIEALDGKTVENEKLLPTQYRRMGNALRELHEFSIEKIRKTSSVSYLEYYNREQHKWEKLRLKLKNDTFSVWNSIIEKTDMFLHDFNIKSNDCIVLCHNDYCERNVLFKDNDITGIIDFEKARYADPFCDFATFIIKDFDTQNLSLFFNSYTLKVTNEIKTRLLYFTLYKALEILTWAEKVDETYYLMAVNFLQNWERLYEYI